MPHTQSELTNEPADAAQDILAAFTEFTLLADRLRITGAERRSILGVPEPVWAALTEDQARLTQVADPAHLRRLRYALGLMRREAMNGA
ncbi:MAG: hypothetical protein KGL12_10950 [Rhodospirillales bacterium]|nr:hypothetical protein [Rhodospirillales bacterium]